MTISSPLRYPGGKQKLTPFLVELLEKNDLIGGHYIEPYAGGAGAAVQLLLSRQVRTIHLNDSSRAIYAFWQAVLTYTEDLCRLVKSASLTVKEWERHKYILKNSEQYDDLTLGFSTFYLNRVNRSGVLSGGLIGGINQTGNYKMDARFARNELIRRIETIAMRADDITLSNQDAEQYLVDDINLLPANTLIYFDPPYYEKASGLYLDFYRKSDHARLAGVIQSITDVKWVLSYDGAPQIIDLYKSRKFFTYDLQYNASTIYKGKEVFVFCDDLLIPNRSKLHYINTGLQFC